MKGLNKLFIISSEFPPHPGGIGNHAFNLSKNLSDNGTNVCVITKHQLSHDEENNFDKSLKFNVIRIIKKKNFIYNQINKILCISDLLGPRSFVIVSGLPSILQIGFIKIFFKKNIKVILVAHGLDINPKNILVRFLVKFFSKKFTKIIAVSNYTKSMIDWIPSKNIKVINNGIGTNLNYTKSSKSVSKNSLKLLTVGSVSERKGQINVINSLIKLKDTFNNITYNIVGKEYEKNKLIKIIKRKGLEKNVVFHGVLSDERLNDMYRESDIFLMLSNKTTNGDFEGFGIAIIEANLYGIPSIGSKDCGIEDAIDHGISGFLVNPKSDDELKSAIKKIVKNYNNFSSNSVKHASNFLWKNIIKLYIKELKDIESNYED